MLFTNMPHDHKYRAKLKENHIRWPDGVPAEFKDKKEHDIEISPTTNGKKELTKDGAPKAAEYLQKLAETGLVTNEWVKEWKESRIDSSEVLARSKKAAEILEKLSKLDPFRDIKDPVAWQREIREDRPLP